MTRPPARDGRLLEVRTGPVAAVEHRGRAVPTAFRKQPHDGPVAVSAEGLDGDHQADRRAHGGPEKALCVYPAEHRPWWRDRLGVDLAPGAFGENLVTTGLTEAEVHLGDRFAIGDVVVEVSMPRRPCYKLAAVHGITGLPDLVQHSGRTGFYLRVVTPGRLRAGDPVRQVATAEASVSVLELNRVMNLDKDDLAAAAVLSGNPPVPERWRHSLARRLEGRREDDGARLRGD